MNNDFYCLFCDYLRGVLINIFMFFNEENLILFS